MGLFFRRNPSHRQICNFPTNKMQQILDVEERQKIIDEFQQEFYEEKDNKEEDKKEEDIKEEQDVIIVHDSETESETEWEEEVTIPETNNAVVAVIPKLCKATINVIKDVAKVRKRALNLKSKKIFFY